MSKSHYPGANTTAQYWAGKFTGSNMNTNCACIHTTEGFTWPSYGAGASAPHMTILPNIKARTVSVRQHFPAGKSSRALVNLSGGVETNTLNVFQIELIGTCDSRYRERWGSRRAGIDYIYWPDAPQWLIDAIAPVFRWLDAEWPNFKVADAAPRGWVEYPASYGLRARQRMTFAEWRNAYGIFGHQHVPENTHGDPGNFPIAKLIDAIGGGSEPVPAPKPKPKQVRWFEHRHLNAWGDDGSKGTKTLKDRLPRMVADLTDGSPEVITLNEVRPDQVPGWRKALKAEGYDVPLAEHGNLVAVPKGTKIGYAGSYILPKKVQGEGRKEALGRVRAHINGHWVHIGVSHLDYRNGPRFDTLRVRQAASCVRAMRRFGLRYGLPTWRKRTSLAMDENSVSWVRDRAMKPRKFAAVVKDGIDAIYSRRPAIDKHSKTTASDHPIVAVTYGKKA